MKRKVSAARSFDLWQYSPLLGKVIYQNKRIKALLSSYWNGFSNREKAMETELTKTLFRDPCWHVEGRVPKQMGPDVNTCMEGMRDCKDGCRIRSKSPKTLYVTVHGKFTFQMKHVLAKYCFPGIISNNIGELEEGSFHILFNCREQRAKHQTW